MKTYKLLFAFLLVGLFSCTDLEEQLNDGLTFVEEGEVDVNELLSGAYGNLRDLQSQDNMLALTEHVSDELAGPTRGRDWDDAGIWRVLHTHSWTTAHQYVNSVWRTLNRNSFNAQEILCQGATGQVAAEATFLKALADFWILDMYGKIPRRACDENLVNPPSTLLTRAEAIGVIIGELEAVMGSLPDGGNAAQGTKDAANALLAKMYLNKAVYEATADGGAAQAGPYTFASADMDKVIAACDAIINTGSYAVDDNYFDNFIPDNGSVPLANWCLFLKTRVEQPRVTFGLTGL